MGDESPGPQAPRPAPKLLGIGRGRLTTEVDRQQGSPAGEAPDEAAAIGKAGAE
jgi:hypothetical protein